MNERTELKRIIKKLEIGKKLTNREIGFCLLALVTTNKRR